MAGEPVTTTVARLRALLLGALLVLGALPSAAEAAEPRSGPKAMPRFAVAAAKPRSPAATAAVATSRRTLAEAVETVTSATAVRYGATDDRGEPLDALEVVQQNGTNIGVYHTPVGNGFNVHVATSDDLINWTRRGTLDTNSSQAAIMVLPGGAFLVAYEKAFVLEFLPHTLRGRLDSLSFPLDRIRLRFRYYRSVEQLFAGQFQRQFTAPRLISPTAEGTPSFISAVLRRGLTSRSRIEVGLHAFSDLNGDGHPDADRRAVGVLTDFHRWEERPAPEIDAAFLGNRLLHKGLNAPPRGHIGDRDDVWVNGVKLQLHEAQYLPGAYASWRIFLMDARTRAPRPLQIRTHGGSQSFGNPNVTWLVAPSGRPALFVSLFIFNEGAAPREAGPLIYYREM